MSIAATRLDEYRLDYSKSNYDAAELRGSMYGAYETFKADTPLLIPGYADLIANRQAAVRTISIPVINRKESWNAASTRTCSALTGENTSAYVTPTWTTLKDGFSMMKAQYYNNYIDYQADFNNKMKQMQDSILRTLDTAGYTHLNTNRTATNDADGNPYTVTANSMIVPAADNDLFLNELGAIMVTNDFSDAGVNIVSSPRFANALTKYGKAQGAANDENLVFQYPGFSFKTSNRVTITSSAYRDTLYAVPQGNLGFLSWVDPDADHGHESSDGKIWSKQFLPMLGIDVGLLFQSTCSAGTTAYGTGYDATLTESFAFSFDYSFVSAYNSATGTYAGAIFKADLIK